MKRWIVGAIVGAGLYGASPAAADQEKAHARLGKAMEASQRGDCPAALRLLKPQFKPKAVSQLDPEVATLAYQLAAYCAVRAGNLVDARAFAVAGTAFESASDELWQLRLSLDVDVKALEDAVATVVAMSEGRGRALNTYELRWLYRLDTQLREAKADAARERFLRVMTASGFDPEEPMASKDGFRERLMRILHARGDNAGVAALVAEIETTSVLIRLSVQPEFAALLPAGFDPRAAAEGELKRVRASILRYPRHLAPILSAARLLRGLGRPGEALAVLESARGDGKQLADFLDAAERSSWWWDALGGTHATLGDVEASLAAYREGGRAAEDGGPNVSQIINMAGVQNRFGRFADALKTLPADGANLPISPFGAMQIRLVRVCANVALGNAAAVAADRALIEANSKDDPESLRDLYLCVGDIDAAAKAVIAELDDPDQRVETLLDFSDYDASPESAPVPRTRATFLALKQRADVQAALKQAGGTRRFALQSSRL
ncbi:hypothetical protein K9B35_04185 [Sphingomonas sp. R647]|uniref:hypothetical protein n=1 Tax=Sphingomonas sp. R647 TaxID=2875233 RepID=UPI001CD5BC4C|nr:hypothetical protein [Sphingomonas sp. R647]MCA1197154.1 hypothetical protein [Sphingomonas sp. R647]